MNRELLRFIRTPALLLLMILPLTGCWDRTEINDLAFVLTVACDLDEDGQLRYSVLVPLPGQMGGPGGGGGGTAGEKSYYIDSDVGATYLEAKGKLQKRMSRRIFLAHRRTVLVGEDLAKKVGIREIFDPASRSPESRMTTYMIVTKGKAYDMLQSTPRFERFPSEAIRELAKSKSLINMNMKDVALLLSTPGSDPVVPYMAVTKSQKSEKPSKEVDILGYAQFKKDRMVGVLQDRSASGLTWLKNQNAVVTANLNVQGELINVRFINAVNRIRVVYKDGKLSFDILIKAEGKIQESTGVLDYSMPGNIMLTQNAMNEYIKGSVQEAIAQMKKNKTDSAQFGSYLWRGYPQVWEDKYETDWPKGLAEASFNILVQSELSETGMTYDNVAKERKN